MFVVIIFVRSIAKTLFPCKPTRSALNTPYDYCSILLNCFYESFLIKGWESFKSTDHLTSCVIWGTGRLKRYETKSESSQVINSFQNVLICANPSRKYFCILLLSNLCPFPPPHTPDTKNISLSIAQFLFRLIIISKEMNQDF